MIPEADDAITLVVQKVGPSGIVRAAVEMLRAVQLNNDPSIDATKIDDVWTHGMLPSKLKAAKLSRA